MLAFYFRVDDGELRDLGLGPYCEHFIIGLMMENFINWCLDLIVYVVGLTMENFVTWGWDLIIYVVGLMMENFINWGWDLIFYVVGLMMENFVTWGWDLTFQKNKQRLLGKMKIEHLKINYIFPNYCILMV